MAGKPIADLAVRIGANTIGLTQGLSSAKKELSKFGQIGKLIGPELTAALSTTAIVAFGAKSVQAYDKSIQAEKQLLNALNGRQDVQQSLLKQASDIQGRTTFEDDDIVAQQKYLASLKLNESQIKKVIEASIQLSTATGQDLDTSVKQLAQTYGGTSKGLGKMIPQIKAMTEEQLKNGDAVEYVVKNFKGYAEVAAREGLGPMKQFENNLGNIQEMIGAGLNPVINKLVDNLNELAMGVMPKQSDAIREQKTELNGLVFAATNAASSTDVRRLAIETITRKYPDYLKGLDAEKVTNEQLTSRLKDVNAEYDKKIAYMVKEELISESNRKISKMIAEQLQLQVKLNELIENPTRGRRGANSKRGEAIVRGKIVILQEDIDKEKKKIDAVLNEYSKKYKDPIITIPTPPLGGAPEDVYKFVGSLEDLKKQLSELEDTKQKLPWAEQNIQKIADLNDQIDVLKKKISELENASNKSHPIEQVPELLKPKGISVDPLPEKIVLGYENKMQRMIDVSEDAAYMIHGLFTDMAVGIGESLGNLLSGETGLESLFSNVLGSFGRFAKQFGELLIAQALAVQALKKAFVNPAVAFAAGIALVAIGTAMENVQRKAAPKLANGGLAYGPTYAMVGDNRNANIDPEVIAPLSKLKGILGTQETMKVEFVGKIQGRDIIFSQVKEARRRKLTN